MQHSRSFKPSVFLFVIVLATIACGLPTSFGRDTSGLETATASSKRATASFERATALAESIDELEVQIDDMRQTQEASQSGTATSAAERKATAEAELATANAIVDSTATQSALEQAAATGTSAVIQPTLESLSNAAGRPEDYSLLFLETFDDNQRDWGVGRDASDYGVNNMVIERGYLEWELDADQGVFIHRMPHMWSVSDFYVSVDAQRISGDFDGHYGIVFRHVDYDNFYSFEVDDFGQQFWIYAMEDDAWDFIFGGTSSAIKYNEVNRLAVVGEGNTFTFYVNDYQIGQIYDDRFGSGTVGVSISLPGSNKEAAWQFDNLAVYAPED